jgi:hypothetical protein
MYEYGYELDTLVTAAENGMQTESEIAMAVWQTLSGSQNHCGVPAA